MVYLLNWWLASVFTYAYLRLWKLEPEVALVGAVGVLCSGSFQLYLPMREVAGVAAWFPLLLYAIERSVREPGWRGRHLVLAIGVYCSINGGQPEVTFISLLIVLVYALLRLLSKPRQARNSLLAITPGAVAGLLLSAPLLLNFVSYAFNAYSLHASELASGQMQLGFSSLGTFIFPFMYGRVQFYPFGEIVGWQWNLAPGWATSITLFLGFLSLIVAIKKPQMGLGFLLLVAMLVAAKIWGLPVVSEIGKLPFFELAIFPRWASPLLAISVAGVSAFGANWLSRLDPRMWLGWMIVWIALTLALFALGLQPIWPMLKNGFSIGDRNVVLMLGGLSWALVAPLMLWWIRYRRPDDAATFLGLAGFGIILQGIAYSSNGYTGTTYIILAFGCLVLYTSSAAILGLVRRIRPGPALVASALILTGSVPLLTAFCSPSGLPARYNPLTSAPYIDFLKTIQANNLYRSYSFDCAPYPDFAAPFGFSSLENIDPLLPAGSAEFMYGYLDSRMTPLIFLGNSIGEQSPNARTALDEYFKNKRYFDLVGVKYLVTRHTGPNTVFQAHQTNPKLDRAPLQLSRQLEVNWLCPIEELSSIEILFSTYARQNAGVVTLSILSSDGTLLRQSNVQAKQLVDNRMQRFEFAPISGVKGQQILLRLSFAASAPESMIAVWVSTGENSTDFAFRIPGQEGSPFFLIYFDREGDVQIWENGDAKPRVFLAPMASVAGNSRDALSRLNDTPDLTRQVWLDQGTKIESTWPVTEPTSSLETFTLEPNDIWTRLQAHTSGIVTVTESYSDGWSAELDGKKTPVLRVNGAFLGVLIDAPGIYDLHLKYRPPFWNMSLGMAGAGALIVLIGTLLGKRKKRIGGLSVNA